MTAPEMQWQVQAQEACSVRLCGRVPAGLAQLDGHFPAFPIVPGVVQLDWAVTAARQWFSVLPCMQSVEVLKFQAVMTPETVVELLLQWFPDKNKVEFVFSSASSRHASGRLVFVEDAA